jgi:mannose-6-phosphate isomerase-like protein (cupin superfamily)
MGERDWKIFELAEQVDAQRASRVPYREFLRVPSLSLGIYSLAAGSRDLQAPHDEDEVYYVVAGRGRIQVEGGTHQVGPGSILYVRAADHTFFEIEEDMTLLVFFASGGPSEGSEDDSGQ